MKFKMTITKSIIAATRMCSKENPFHLFENCAFARAYNELIPNVSVESSHIYFHAKDTYSDLDCPVQWTPEQMEFINRFDNATPEQRLEFPEQTFEVEIPDSVIEYWYQSHADAAAKIANSKILELI